MPFSDLQWLLFSRAGKIGTNSHWAYWECFVRLCKNGLIGRRRHQEREGTGYWHPLGPVAPVCWGQELSFEGRPFVIFLAACPRGCRSEVVPSSPQGTFWMVLLLSAYDALASVAREIWWYCRAGNGVLTSRGEHIRGFWHRRFDLVLLRAGLPAK